MAAPRTVLAVDDSPTIRRIVELVLRRAGYDVVTSATSVAALTTIADRRPDVILLDASLPQTDGYALCQMLRRDLRLRDVPVVLVHDRRGLIHRLKSHFAGVTDQLVKPFRPNDLVAVVARQLAPVT